MTLFAPVLATLAALPLPLYMFLCLLVGVVARRTWLGLFGYTVLSFVITPLLSSVILLLAARRAATPRELELERELERVLIENDGLRRRLAGERPRWRLWR